MRGANERNGESMRILADSHCHIYPEKIARKAVEGVRHFYEGLAFSPFAGSGARCFFQALIRAISQN